MYAMTSERYVVVLSSLGVLSELTSGALITDRPRYPSTMDHHRYHIRTICPNGPHRRVSSTVGNIPGGCRGDFGNFQSRPSHLPYFQTLRIASSRIARAVSLLKGQGVRWRVVDDAHVAQVLALHGDLGTYLGWGWASSHLLQFRRAAPLKPDHHRFTSSVYAKYLCKPDHFRVLRRAEAIPAGARTPRHYPLPNRAPGTPPSARGMLPRERLFPFPRNRHTAHGYTLRPLPGLWRV
ncbi:hypothetical protein OF83DRAFT_494978 [Amylostereum chailletii]|nr:hypothetical protein OF83DRAFT_494978 [Amylostereum chailletii]